MKRVLIVFASKYGQTEKIGNYLKGKFEESGNVCESHDIIDTEPISLSKYNHIVIGGPVYAGKFHTKLLNWTKRNSDVLGIHSTAFFTVTMNAADKREQARKDDKRLIEEFLEKTALQPQFTASFAGAIKFLEYNWFIRLVMRYISKKAGGPTDTSKNFEFTDWRKVDSFAAAIIGGNRSSEFAYQVKRQPNQAVLIEEDV